MTPTEQAARWLADVKRYRVHPKRPNVMFTADDGRWLPEADALAAIARHLAPGDDLAEVEKVRDWLDKCAEHGGARAYRNAAATITALLARISALTAAAAAKEDECEAKTKTIKGLVAVDELWRRNSRATYEAMVAMRNSINEHLPVPSLESDLLQGPENSVFCAAVADAVVSEVATLRHRLARMEGEVQALEWFSETSAANAVATKKHLDDLNKSAALTEGTPE